MRRENSLGTGSAGRWPAVSGGSPDTFVHLILNGSLHKKIRKLNVFAEPAKTAREPRALPGEITGRRCIKNFILCASSA
jgi:hypothetical protein